jgi:hypothetical protein
MIDWNKPVQTRDGHKVEILTRNLDHWSGDTIAGNILGAPGSVGDSSNVTWATSGAFYDDDTPDDWDLVNVEPIAVEDPGSCPVCAAPETSGLLTVGTMKVQAGVFCVDGESTILYRECFAVELTDDIIEILGEAGYDTEGL